MNLLATNELDQRELRNFGLGLTATMLAMNAVIYWRWQYSVLGIALFVFTCIFACLFFGCNQARRPVHRAFHVLTSPIQWIGSFLILTTVFVGVIVPVGILFRVLGKGIRRKGPTPQSYWQKRNDENTPERYFDAY
ncbi:hypothetical protein [Neorhodopirellula lusitana]|uniref:hypothetical protein n=1 Tax=Neorhodopirellula lusitana TaxID=445327 RepID=UPI00384B5CD6